MAYRKLTADQLFTGYELLGNEWVLVADDKGKVIELVREEAAGEGIERFQGILSPGFINCHCHLELSHMKGVVPQGTGMIKFLLTVMQQRNIGASPGQASLDAEMQMIAEGIVAVGDICNTTATASIKKDSPLFYHNFIEATGFLNATAHARFEQAMEVLSAFTELDKGYGNSIVPHAPYSVSEKLFQLIDHFPGNHLLSIHNQESEDESEFFSARTGAFTDLFRFLNADISFFSGHLQGSLVHTLEHLSERHQLILVHNVHTAEEDLDWIGKHDELPLLFWCLCPNANIYINGQLPDIYLLKKYDCEFVIGTDSLASNTGLSVLEELKTLQSHFSDLSIIELLHWATINGARALNIESRFGSFEKDKVPGIILLENVHDGDISNSSVRRLL